MNIQSNLYLTSPLRAHSLTSPVGAGKSYAACCFLMEPAQRAVNYLYVTPTISLVEQVTKQLHKEAGATAGGRNIHMVHSNMELPAATDDSAQPVAGKTRGAALRLLNGAAPADGLVVVLTTDTLLRILSEIRNPQAWHVICDESFAAHTVSELPLGIDPRETYTYFRELFDVLPEDGYRIVPAYGQKGTVADVADGRYDKVGAKFQTLEAIASLVSNPAIRCEVIPTAPVVTLLAGGVPPRKKTRGKGAADGEDASTMLHFAGYVSPELFKGFKSVLILSALFEQTDLYHLWTGGLGVTFSQHPTFPQDKQRDVHADMAQYVAVGHLLHKRDSASLENLHRSRSTRARQYVSPKANHGSRVLDELVQLAAAYFAEHGGNQPWLLQTNLNRGYSRKGEPLVPAMATPIPPSARGENTWQDFHNVVSLIATNPGPTECAWLASRSKRTEEEVRMHRRVSTVYQAFGRCSIRQRAPICTEPKVLLCAGYSEARFIWELFHGGSTTRTGAAWLGQVTDLKPLGETEKKLSGVQQARRQTMTQKLAAMITQYLAGLGVDPISIRDLKANLVGFQPLWTGGEKPANSEVSEDTWTAAINLATQEGSGWQRVGRSLVRVNLGFVDQT